MNALSWLGTLSADVWPRLLVASLMLAFVGLASMLLMRCFRVRSWKLRSWLVAAVLVQGLIFVRAPLELAWLPPATEIQFADASMEHWPVPAETAESKTAESSGRPKGNTSNQLMLTPVVPEPSLGASLSWQHLTLVLWTIVVTAIAVVSMTRYVRLLRMLHRLPVAPSPWQDAWRRVHRDRVRGTMLVSETVGPLLVRRPVGYAFIVPRGYWERLDETQRNGVMLHEYAHVRRFDVWRQLAARSIATLHWFNPIAWWALRQYEFATEVACDSGVTQFSRRDATGFAAALVELVQWRSERSDQGHAIDRIPVRGIGMQSMAAPPLRDRISRLIQKNHDHGESFMKKLLLGSFAAALITFSCFQIRFVRAQSPQPTVQESGTLQVIDDATASRLQDVFDHLDADDPTTARLLELFQQPSGRIALSGLMDSLVGQAQEKARVDAVPRFLKQHFQNNEQGKLVPRDDETMTGWIRESDRLDSDMAQMRKSMNTIAAYLHDSSEAGGLFKRLLNDPQTPAAIMINEMDGGDVVTKYLSKALGNLLVRQPNGTLQVVESRRSQVKQQLERLEFAEKLRLRFLDEFPNLSAEYVDNDERHQRLNAYLNNPLTASLVALDMSGKSNSIPVAVEKLYQNFENASRDTPEGLTFANDEAWSQMEEVFDRVDRVARALPSIRERMADYAEQMDSEDPMTQRFAALMLDEPLAVGLAAELPYADANPGAALEALLSEVIDKQGEIWRIREENQEEVAQKARELLQACRRIRRYSNGIERMLTDVADRNLVAQLGESGRYVILNEVRKFAMQYRPDPIELLKTNLLAETEGGWQVREDRREVIRELVEQAERVRSESANDDF